MWTIFDQKRANFELTVTFLRLGSQGFTRRIRKISCADFLEIINVRTNERTDKRESIGLRDSLETKKYENNRCLYDIWPNLGILFFCTYFQCDASDFSDFSHEALSL